MLHLKHRPRDWNGYVESSPDVGKFRAALESGRFTGGAVLITGPSSSGKTTLAQLVAEQCGDCIEVNGADCGVDKVRSLAGWMRTRLTFGESDQRAVIVNECQSMTDAAVECWLDVLDHLAPRVIVLFTSTEDVKRCFKEFGEPFVSRCRKIVLQRPSELPAIARLRDICTSEGICATDWQLGELLRREGRNLRACIDRLDDLPEPPVIPIPAQNITVSPENITTSPPIITAEPPAPVVQPTVQPPEDPERERQQRMAADIARATAPVESRHIEVKPVEPPMAVNQLVAFLKTQGIKCKPGEAALALSACNGSIEQLEKMLNVPIRKLNEEGIALESAKSDKPKREKPKAAAEPKPSKFGKKSAPAPGPRTYTISRAHEAIAWVAFVLIAWPCAQFAWWSFGSMFSESWALANHLVGK